MNPLTSYRSLNRQPSNETQARRHKPDYLLVVLAMALLLCGLIVAYAISPGVSIQRGVSESYFVSKQIISVVLGTVAFFVCANLPVIWWKKVEKPMIVLASIAAVAVRLFADPSNGAQRWIQFGGLSFQAAELIKFALVLWLAGFLAARIKQGEVSSVKKTLQPLIIVMAIITIVVAGLESDLGSAGVMIAMIIVTAFVAGVPMKRIFLAGGVVLFIALVTIMSTAYRRERILTFLNPERDCRTSGYQICESLQAIGSGGMFGKGLGKSVQAYGYLPEAANDSIFSILSEKFGFIGVTSIIGVYALLFSRLYKIIQRAPNAYSQLLVSGILAWVSTQMIVNVGAMLGLLPLKGITLPFISYGGTSLLFVTAALGIAFQISHYTTYTSGGKSRQSDRPTYKRTVARRYV